ncbi:MAG: sigma-E processing peptidase SpoIIGA [Oscillospiraceae bacterium]|nr:sigma-E processing peptidase SpoIIGA [Oscillospiraceae bacterium]
MVVYADLLFLINWLINGLLLVITARICDYPAPRRLCLLGGALGAGYSVCVLYWPVLTHPLIKLSVGIAMVLCVFFRYGPFVRACLIFFAVSAAFGGAVYGAGLLTGRSLYGLYTPISLRVLILSFAVSYGLIRLVFARFGKHAGELAAVRIRLGDRTVNLHAIRDTGNSLKDPMTGRPAVVVSPDALAPLLDSGTVAILRQPGPAALSELADGPVPFRLIPYHTVSSGCELMAAFTPHGVWVDGKPVKAVVAVAPRSVSDGGAYSALLSV